MRAEANYAETIRAGEKEKAMLHEQTEKLHNDLNSSGKQVRFCVPLVYLLEITYKGTIHRHYPSISN